MDRVFYPKFIILTYGCWPPSEPVHPPSVSRSVLRGHEQGRSPFALGSGWAWEPLTIIGCIESNHCHSYDSQEQDEHREADLQWSPSLFLLRLWSIDISYIHLTFWSSSSPLASIPRSASPSPQNPFLLKEKLHSHNPLQSAGFGTLRAKNYHAT